MRRLISCTIFLDCDRNTGGSIYSGSFLEHCADPRPRAEAEDQLSSEKITDKWPANILSQSENGKQSVVSTIGPLLFYDDAEVKVKSVRRCMILGARQ